MTVSTERAAIDPRVGHRIQHLLAVPTEQLRDHGCRRDAYEQHVVETDAVETVLQCDHALYFVRFDHRCQHIVHRQRILARGTILPAQVIGHGQDAAEVVRRVAPFRRKPCVVEIEPAVHRADVECRHHGVEFV